MRIRVYPEYYDGSLLGRDIEIFAKEHEGFSRMFLQQDGETIFFYDKRLSDGKNIASIEVYQPKIYEVGNVAIGLICCMDVQAPEVCLGLMEKLKSSSCRNKVICISAYMTHKDWFSSVNPPLNSVHVALSNGCENGPNSFISDNSGKKIKATKFFLDGVCIEVVGVDGIQNSNE